MNIKAEMNRMIATALQDEMKDTTKRQFFNTCDRDRRKGHLGLGTGVEEIWVVEKLCYSLQ
jgi:hypothetical protein